MGKLQLTREKLKCCAEHLRYYSSYHSCYSSDSRARAPAVGCKCKLASDSCVSGASPRICSNTVHARYRPDRYGLWHTPRYITVLSFYLTVCAAAVRSGQLSGSVWRKTRLLAGVEVGLDFEFYGRWMAI